MDYEKKKRLTELRDSMKSYGYMDGVEELEDIFPEIKESEEEGIRKFIIDCIDELRKANADNADFNGRCSEAIAYLEEQKEQKPAEWSADDEEMLLTTIEYIQTYPAHLQSIVRWLKSLPKRFNPQPKQEWSEEDEEMLQRIIRYTESEYQDWCNDKYGHSEIVSDGKQSCLERLDWLENRLKSLCSKPHWKPSKEQMDILDKVYHYLWADRNATADMQDGLGDFIDELKNL